VKVQIIYLDTSDDQVSARDKLSWIQAQRALLVWPRRGSVLTSRLDLMLIARAASHRGTTLGLVTHDPVVRDHASDLGIPLFDSIDDLPEERWHVARKGKTRRPSVHEKPSDLADLQRAAQDLDAGHSRVSWLGRWLLFVLAIAAVAAMLVFIAPSADIVLTPKTERQSLDLSLVLDSEGAAAMSEGRLPARRIETTLSAELRTPTTGVALAPSGLAKGTVVFTNLTGDGIDIPAGTGVRSGNEASSVRFETLEPVTLGAEEGAQASVEVQAVVPGPSGNLPSGALDAVEGPIGLVVSATNPERMSGGHSGPQAGVSARDVQDLELEVRRMLLSQAEHTLGDELRNDEVLAPASIAISQVLESEFDHEVGDPAESLQLRLRAVVSGLAYSRSDLVELAGESLDASLSPQTEAVPGSLGYEEIASKDGVGSSPAAIHIRAWREVYPHLDTALAKKLVRGMDEPAAIAILARQFELGALPRIRLHPAWWPRMPFLEVRIAVYWPWGARG
jgi:hypothetical protein